MKKILLYTFFSAYSLSLTAMEHAQCYDPTLHEMCRITKHKTPYLHNLDHIYAQNAAYLIIKGFPSSVPDSKGNTPLMLLEKNKDQLPTFYAILQAAKIYEEQTIISRPSSLPTLKKVLETNHHDDSKISTNLKEAINLLYTYCPKPIEE